MTKNAESVESQQDESRANSKISSTSTKETFIKPKRRPVFVIIAVIALIASVAVIALSDTNKNNKTTPNTPNTPDTPNTPTTTRPVNTTTSPVNWWVFAAIAGGVVALIGLIVFFVSRERRSSEDFEEKIQKAEKRVADTQQQLVDATREYETRIKGKEKDIENLGKLITSLNETDKKAEDVLQALENIENMKNIQEKDRLNKQIKELGKQVATLEDKYLIDTMELSSRLRMTKKELDDTQQERVLAHNRFIKFKQITEMLVKDKDSVQRDRDSIQKELQSVKDTLATIRENAKTQMLAKFSEIDNLNEAKEQLEREKESLIQEKQELEKLAEERNTQIKQYENDLFENKEQIRKLEKENKELLEGMVYNATQYKSLAGQKNEVDRANYWLQKEKEKLEESNAELQNEINVLLDKAEQIIEKKQEEIDQALSDQQQKSDAAMKKLERELENKERELEDAIDEKKIWQDSYQKIEDQLLEKSGVSQVSDDDRKEQTKNLKNQVKELRNEIKDMNEEKQRLQKAAEEAEKNLNQEKEKLKQEKEKYEEVVAQLKNENQGERSRYENAKKALTELREIMDLNLQGQIADEEFSRVALAGRDEEIQKQKEEIAKLMERIEQLSEGKAQKELEQLSLEKQRETELLKEALRQTEQLTTEQQDQIEELKNRLSELDTFLKDQIGELDRLSFDRSVETNQFRVLLELLEQARKERDATIKTLTEQNTSLSSEKQTQVIQIAKIQAQLDSAMAANADLARKIEEAKEYELERLQRDVDTARIQLEKEELIKSVQEATEETKAENEGLIRANQKLATKLAESEQRLAKFEKKASQVTKELAKQLEDTRKLFKESSEKIERQRDTDLKEITRLTSELQDTKKELDGKIELIKTLAKKQQTSEADLKQAELLINDRNKVIETLQISQAFLQAQVDAKEGQITILQIQNKELDEARKREKKEFDQRADAIRMELDEKTRGYGDRIREIDQRLADQAKDFEAKIAKQKSENARNMLIKNIRLAAEKKRVSNLQMILDEAKSKISLQEEEFKREKKLFLKRIEFLEKKAGRMEKQAGRRKKRFAIFDKFKSTDDKVKRLLKSRTGKGKLSEISQRMVDEFRAKMVQAERENEGMRATIKAMEESITQLQREKAGNMFGKPDFETGEERYLGR